MHIYVIYEETGLCESTVSDSKARYMYSLEKEVYYTMWELPALVWKKCVFSKINQRTEGPESRTDGETLIFWDW